MGCVHCGTEIPRGGTFCPHCGAVKGYRSTPPIIMPRRERLSFMAMVQGISAWGVLALLFLLMVNVVIALWSIWLITPYALEDYTTLFIVTPWIVPIVNIHGIGFAIVHAIFVLAIALSFAFSVKVSWERFGDELMFRSKERSPLFIIGTIFFALLFFNTIFYLLIGASGNDPVVPDHTDVPLWQNIYYLTRASVWEEVITRVLYIGVPLLLVHTLQGKREKVWRYAVGGGFQLGKWELTFVTVSSVVFALAHVFGWDWYKVVPTFIAGLAFGYLFLRFGLWASILLHFAFDYLSMPMEVNSSVTVLVLIGLLMLIWIAIGAVQFGLYTRDVVGFIRPASKDRPTEPEPPRNGFVCPSCGNTKARYVNGELECLHCGKRF